MISEINVVYFTVQIRALDATELVYCDCLNKSWTTVLLHVVHRSCVSLNVYNTSTSVNELNDYSLNSSDKTNNLLNW
jgi:hypothetical protein